MWRSTTYQPVLGTLDGFPAQHRHLSDLLNCFVDQAAYNRALQAGDPIIYSVTPVEENKGDGQLYYVLAVLHPGKIGAEYHMTKGHIHAWRPAAEVYIGVNGRGLMLLEDERTGETSALALEKDTIVYIPGHVAHRTVNTGDEPLTYWGILPYNAGADYEYVVDHPFRHVVVEVDGQARVIARHEYLP